MLFLPASKHQAPIRQPWFISLSMVVLNSKDWPRKSGIRNFGVSKIHLSAGFTQKNQPKCIGTTTYNNTIPLLNVAKSQIFHPLYNFKI